jgi:hypothetical protein
MRSEPVHHFLCSDFRIIIVVIAHLGIHVVDRADRQKVKLADRKTDLYAPQKKGSSLFLVGSACQLLLGREVQTA